MIGVNVHGMYLFNRRAETGQPISTYWWNADHWANNAAADGYTVNNTPTAGSIMQNYEGPMVTLHMLSK